MKRVIRFILNLIGSLLLIIGIVLAVSFIIGGSDRFNLNGLLECHNTEDFKEWYSGNLQGNSKNEPVYVSSVSVDKYAYQLLDEETKDAYDQIYAGIMNHDDKIPLLTKDEAVIKKAFEAIMADYGNLFWIDGYQFNTYYSPYSSGKEVLRLEFMPKYTMTKEQRDANQTAVDAAVDEWLKGISTNASDFDKALYVFESLINTVEYDSNSKENQNILSVFLYHSTVCQGYSDAAWYLLDRLGIKSTIITGTANGENHAWNLVNLDGAYYYMDVTFGNSKYFDANNSTQKRINHTYFAMTTEEMSQNHVITSSFAVPECVSNKDNYYVHKRLYYDWFGADAIGNRLADSFNSGEESISLKFSSTDIYNRVIDYFIKEAHLYDYCNLETKLYYLEDEESNVLTIHWGAEE